MGEAGGIVNPDNGRLEVKSWTYYMGYNTAVILSRRKMARIIRARAMVSEFCPSRRYVKSAAGLARILLGERLAVASARLVACSPQAGWHDCCKRPAGLDPACYSSTPPNQPRHLQSPYQLAQMNIKKI